MKRTEGVNRSAKRKPVHSDPRKVTVKKTQSAPVPLNKFESVIESRRDIIIRSARLLVALVFLAAAVAKGIDPFRFSRQVEAILWGMGLPVVEWVNSIAGFGAAAIILAEFIVAGFLMGGIAPRTFSGIATAMLAGFGAVTAWSWWAGVETDCGCFGGFVQRSAQIAVLENLLLLIPASAGMLKSGLKKRSIKLAIATVWIGIALLALATQTSLPRSSLRKGIEPRLPESLVIDPARRTFFWFFDPDCERCQRQLTLVKAIGGARLTGVASTTEGRLNEFRIDFDDTIPFVNLSRDQFDRLGVSKGTLIEIRDGKLTRFWPPYILEDEKRAVAMTE